MKLALPILISLAIAAPVAADDCRHTAARQLAVSAEGVRVVEIRAGAGSLTVRGDAGPTVRASGTACSSKAGDLEEIRLESRRRGDRLVVEALFPDSRTWSFGKSVQRRLDFTVELPAHLPVAIEDGSGSITVRNVAAVEVEDGSGPIDIRGVAGAVRIDDGSGDILVQDAGSVHVNDGSGDIEIRSIRGDVVIEDDGSGGIEIVDVAGSVLVENDGSGSIDVRNIGGDFTVRNDGSGGVSVTGVRGRVSLPRD